MDPDIKKSDKAINQSVVRVGYSSQYEVMQNAVERTKSDLHKINTLVVGVLIFTVVSFVVAVFIMLMDGVRDKALYLRYSDVYQNYVDENMRLRDEINNQKLDFNNFQNQFNMLRIKNSYLK